MPTASTWTDTDTQKALAAWDEYQRQHDVSDRRGQAVGIDPHTGEVFFGATAAEIGTALLAEGRHRPLYFLRVGSPFYARKVGKRCSQAK